MNDTDLQAKFDALKSAADKLYLELVVDGGYSDDTLETLRIALGQPTEEEARDEFIKSLESR